jgi:hypothetical protein
VAGWLPRGDWKIVQIDNSNAFSRDEFSLFLGLLFGAEFGRDLNNRTFLFQYPNSEGASYDTDLMIANAIFALLLLEGHGYVVSSGSARGERLAVQDGAIQFLSRDESMSGAEMLLRRFEREPARHPQWVVDAVAADQQPLFPA